jgi:hypothetical protein
MGLVGYALSGLRGERLLKRLGIKSGNDTVLRRVRARGRSASQPPVQVPSVEDGAKGKLPEPFPFPMRTSSSEARCLSPNDRDVCPRQRSDDY